MQVKKCRIQISEKEDEPPTMAKTASGAMRPPAFSRTVVPHEKKIDISVEVLTLAEFKKTVDKAALIFLIFELQKIKNLDKYRV